MRKLFRFKRLRRGGRSRVGNAALFVVMIALSVLMIAPLVYSVINSFKPLDELFAYPPRFFVVRPTMENYSMLFKLVANMRVPFSRYLFNSAFITALTTVASVVIASMAAYPLAKYKLRLGWLFDLVVLTLLFNGTVLALPQYVIMARLHLINLHGCIFRHLIDSNMTTQTIATFKNIFNCIDIECAIFHQHSGKILTTWTIPIIIIHNSTIFIPKETVA